MYLVLDSVNTFCLDTVISSACGYGNMGSVGNFRVQTKQNKSSRCNVGVPDLKEKVWEYLITFGKI